MIEELKRTIDAQGTAFEEFKKSNDAAIAELKTKGAVDPALAANVEKATTALTELGDYKRRLELLETRAARLPLGADGKEVSADVIAHKDAFRQFVRKGNDTGLAELEQKAITVGSNPDGGFALPIDQDRDIGTLLKEVSPMREVARVVTIGTTDYRKLFNVGGFGSGWVGETDPRPVTSTPQLVPLAPFFGEIYANPQASQQSLDDLFFDVEAFINEGVSEEFGKQERIAFVSGDGVKKPKGFLSYAVDANKDSARAFGTIQAVNSGDAAGFVASSAAASPVDALIAVRTALRAGYRTNAKWMMNSSTIAYFQTVKDMQGNYIWRPGMEQGASDTILGFPVVINEDMPDIAAGTYPVAFANWNQAYTIFDRIGIRTLRDPYTNKPFVGFYTTKRVGSMLENSETIKLLKIAA